MELVNKNAPSPTYHYPFSSLNFKGVLIQNSDIDILVGRQFDVRQPQIVLGILTLTQLRIYMAYKEKVIYLTPAEAR